MGSAPAPPEPVDEPPRHPGLRDLALVRGFPEAIRILGRWLRDPLTVLGPWLVVSLLVALLLLGLTWLVATIVEPDPTRPRGLPGRGWWDSTAAYLDVLRRNLVVLALHATACLAGYIVHVASDDPTLRAGSRLERATRITARIALWFVPAATILSIATQSWVLGSYASTAAAHLHMTPLALLVTTLTHSVLELVAIFLPLAAWLVALPRRRLGELYAATLLSVLVAVPMLAGAAALEVQAWPGRVRDAERSEPRLEGRSIATIVPVEQLDDAAELVFGERLPGGPWVDLAAAEAAARDAAGGGAVALVELGYGYEIHRVRERPLDDVCGRGSGRGDRTDLGRIGPWRVVRVGSRALPDGVAEFDVVLLVGQGLRGPGGATTLEAITTFGAARQLVAQQCGDSAGDG